MTVSENISAPVLLIAALLILILFQSLIFAGAEPESGLEQEAGDYIIINGAQYRPDRFFLLATASNICAFLLPAFFYIKLKGGGYVKKLKLSAPKPKYLLLSLYMFCAMLSGAVLINSLLIYAGAGFENALPPFVVYTGGDPAYNTGVIISFVALPAFCEEFFFRSALAAEYEKHGVFCAAVITSAAFAMAHFSIWLFPSYFFAAIILYAAAKITGSVFYAAALHAGYNFFNIYLWERLARVLNFEQNRGVFIFLSAIALAVFIIFALNNVEFIYYEKAHSGSSGGPQTNRPAPDNKTKKSPALIVKFFKSFLSPTFLAAAAIFFIYINLK